MRGNPSVTGGPVVACCPNRCGPDRFYAPSCCVISRADMFLSQVYSWRRPCGSSAVRLSSTSQTRGTQRPLVQGSLGTTLLFHMIPRSLASDARWSKPPIFCTLRYSYAPTEPVEDYRVLSSQSEKSIGTMHTPATHRPVWLSRCRVGTRCVVGLKLLCGNARSPVM